MYEFEYVYENVGLTELDIRNFDTPEEDYEHADWCYGEDECSC